eukprot:5042441-Prymnesium_polylepis.4
MAVGRKHHEGASASRAQRLGHWRSLGDGCVDRLGERRGAKERVATTSVVVAAHDGELVIRGFAVVD